MTIPVDPAALAVLVELLAQFPHEAVPDGHVDAPHHLYVGLAVLAFVVWRVSDDLKQREPALAFTGGALAWFGFARVWKYYPATGAAFALVGLTVASVGVLLPGGVWAEYPRRERLAALLGLYVAADDVAEHAFGIWTPLDAGFNEVAYLLP